MLEYFACLAGAALITCASILIARRCCKGAQARIAADVTPPPFTPVTPSAHIAMPFSGPEERRSSLLNALPRNPPRVLDKGDEFRVNGTSMNDVLKGIRQMPEDIAREGP